MGHETVVAHTGVSGLELAERFAPETALLDIGLPDMDGYTLADVYAPVIQPGIFNWSP